MTDQELKDLVASLAIQQKETWKNLNEIQEERRKSHEEESKRQAELNRQIDRVNKQIGDLGNKWGSFTEGMAFPSMEKVLSEKFGMETISPNFKVKKNKKTVLEIDVFGTVNSKQMQLSW